MSSKLNFSLTQLEYIVAVNKYGHFAKAAESCHVTQPTLSMQIQKIEDELGVVLFDRSKKPILLTSAGKRLIEQFQTVLYEAKKIESLIESDDKGPVHGELILGVIPTIAPYLLPRLLPSLEHKFPDLELKISELQTHQIVEALNSDEIDAGILAIPLKIPKLFERTLYYEPFHILCKKDHRLAQLKRIKQASLNYEDIWLLKEGHCLRGQILDVCSIEISKTDHRKFNFESGSLETLKNLVNSYGGYTLLPQLATADVGSHSQLIPFERPIPAREVGLVYRREHYKSGLIDAVAEAAVSSIPADLRKIRPKDLEVLPVEDSSN